MNAFPWLSAAIFAPWAGALLLALAPGLGARASRILTLLFSLSTLAIAVGLAIRFDPAGAGFQFAEDRPWIAALHAHYHVGIDGLSLILLLLTGLVAPVALAASWNSARAGRVFGLLFLLLQGSAVGVFVCLDFFPWFLFWELSLIPAFFLIKLWGGEDAPRAAFVFIIYTLAGSAFMLLGFAAIYAAAGTLDFVALARLAATGALAAKLSAFGAFWPRAVFCGVLLGLAVKAPLYPFHTWLPAAYAEAPTGVSIFLTAVLSKMGVYGFFRILWPLFPGALHAAAPVLLALALGGAVLGAYAALRQEDIKRMLAYSSVNHVSYCLLALFAFAARPGATRAAATALDGAILQMFNHGVSAAALFFCAGILESRAAGRRRIADFAGVRAAAPVFAGLGGIALFSSMGLPGLNGFVGEFLIFAGTFGLAPWAAAVACLGLLGTAIFLLSFWRRAFHGPVVRPEPFPDIGAAHRIVLGALAAVMLVFGFFPQPLIALFNPLVSAWAGAGPHP